MAAPDTLTIDMILQGGGVKPKDNTVILTGLDAAILLFLAAAGQVHGALFHTPLIVTSGRDAKHATGSKHYEGKAVDIHVNDLEAGEVPVFHLAASYVAARCKCGIFFEWPGLDTQHFHIETNS